MWHSKAHTRIFGGKSKVANEVWSRFGNVPSYVEPFFGSGAALLARPHAPDLELVNDIDGYIVNFWRAVQTDAEAVASYADWPAFENDLHARHAWLVQRRDSLREHLEGDPDYYDARIAGWWVWGMSLWIGSGFCSGKGSWIVENGRLVKQHSDAAIGGQLPRPVSVGVGALEVSWKLPTLTVQQGVKRNRLDLASDPKGVHRKRLHLMSQKGVQRKLPETVKARGVTARRASGLYAYFAELQARFSRVRVVCGDWTRVISPAVLGAKTPCAVLLDPPYTSEGRRGDLYNHDSATLHVAVREWALANGDNPDYRIAYCGYEDGFEFPPVWEKFTWKANGGYANQGEARKENAARETIWFSPYCLKPETQLSLFAEALP